MLSEGCARKAFAFLKPKMVGNFICLIDFLIGALLLDDKNGYS